MDDLVKHFSSLLTPDQMTEMTAQAEIDFARQMSSHSQGLRVLPPDPRNLSNEHVKDPVFFQANFANILQNSTNPKHPPPTKLPCANVQIEKYTVCENPGTSACSACKLVSYCSKACQKAHWRHHKQDCQNPMRSDDWKPIWVREGRLPSFVMEESLKEESSRRIREGFSIGIALWGNTPAMDVINLSCNEKDSKKDFSLAFIASGDLRHVLRSFNGLPLNYSGNLNVLINDATLPVVCRNLVLLLILGNIPDEAIAADIALHFWYSAFIPAEYRLQITIILTKFLKESRDGDGTFSVPLGSSSNLFVCLPKEATEFFLHFISPSVSVGDIQDEYDRIRTAPSRRDYRDRMYAGLRPSHRVAFQEFRRFGIVLPFGAVNAHFNVPNLSLFSLEGGWWQTDYADPMEGWDINSVVETGKAHGAHVEDIYGCLYFFLSKELREFARRLRVFRSSLTISSFDARNIPQLIHEGLFSDYNIPPSVRFNRIEVSNILDANYVGINGVLTLWGPLLAEGKNAAIVGYFMNWISLQQDGRASRAGRAAMERLLPAVLEKNKVVKKGRTPNSVDDMQSSMFNSLDDAEALYENSKPFSAFLKNQGLDAILRKTKLRLREKHKIVPHRLSTPLTAPSNALPEFPDDDTWYYCTKLTCFTWAERFVEFERV